MNLSDKTLITDTFKCPQYIDLKPISYKFCVSRQATKDCSTNGYLYPECATCVDGVTISKHFGSYKHPNKPKKQGNFGTLKKKRAKKGESPYSGHFIGSGCKNSQVSCGSLAVKLQNESGRNIGPKRGRVSEPESQTLYDLELLIKAQVAYIFQLAHEGKLKNALKGSELL